MFDENFKLNWQRILKYNSSVRLLKESTKMELVKIPLTPIEIDAKLLYYLFEILYPKFINDRQNALDIIISDDYSNILRIYLYETSKVGIFESIKKLDNKSIEFNKEEFNNIEKLFNKIQISVIKTSGIRISSIRVFKETAIDKINKYSRNIENINQSHFLPLLIELIQDLLKQELIFMYPTPNCYIYIHNMITLLNGIKFISIYRFLYNLLPNFKNSLLLDSSQQPLILNLEKSEKNNDMTVLKTTVLDPKRLGIKIDQNSIMENILITIQEQFKSERVYLFAQKDIISLLSKVFELESPLRISALKILLQRTLFGFRSFDKLWQMIPRPLIYNTFIRFFLRLFGINLSLKKLSHWAIPDFFLDFNMIKFGLNANIIVIFTWIKNPKQVNDQFLLDSFYAAILIQIENQTIKSIKSIDQNKLFSQDKFTTLENIRNNASREYGYISAILNIDIIFLKDLFKLFYSSASKYNPLTKFKSFKMIKHNYYFNVFPEDPLIKLIKRKGLKFFIKDILPILIDKHEF